MSFSFRIQVIYPFHSPPQDYLHEARHQLFPALSAVKPITDAHQLRRVMYLSSAHDIQPPSPVVAAKSAIESFYVGLSIDELAPMGEALQPTATVVNHGSSAPSCAESACNDGDIIVQLPEAAPAAPQMKKVASPAKAREPAPKPVGPKPADGAPEWLANMMQCCNGAAD